MSGLIEGKHLGGWSLMPPLNGRLEPEVMEALDALEVAQNKLDMADEPALIDAACHEITAAELRLNEAVRRAKSERGDMVDQVVASGKGASKGQGSMPSVWSYGDRQNRHKGSEGQYPLSVWPGNAPDTADERV